MKSTKDILSDLNRQVDYINRYMTPNHNSDTYSKMSLVDKIKYLIRGLNNAF